MPQSGPLRPAVPPAGKSVLGGASPSSRELQDAVIQGAEPERHQIHDGVLVIAPRLARSLPRRLSIARWKYPDVRVTGGNRTCHQGHSSTESPHRLHWGATSDAACWQ